MKTHRTYKRKGDFSQRAMQIVNISTGEQEDEYTEKNPAAVELGRLGGLKGGKARAEKLAEEERKAVAKKANSVRNSKE